MNKILFISYYWPPSGKASLHLPLYLIKHLTGLGWQPSVLTVNQDEVTAQDSSLLTVVPEQVQVVRTFSAEPFTLYRLFTGKSKDAPLVSSEMISRENRSFTHRLSRAIRMNMFIPDARIGWYPFAVSHGTDVIQREGIQAIICIGPPHTTQLIGRTLSRRCNIPFIPVFIDPWVDIAYYRNLHRSALTLAIDNYFEASVIKDAAKVIFVTRALQEDFLRKYPRLSGKAEILHWGYNEEPFFGIKKSTNSVFTIVHTGNIFDYQNPVAFWELLKKRIDSGRKCAIRFTGTVGTAIRKTISEMGLDSVAEYRGFLPYSEVVQEMMNADLLMVGATEKRHLPGKLFEYLRTGNPIIAFGDDNAEMEELLQEAHAGLVFPYAASGEEIFTEYHSFAPNPEVIKKYERKQLAIKLSEMLQQILQERKQ